MRAAHVILTALKEKDIEILWKWINDREQVIFNAPFQPIHEGQHHAWLEAVQHRKDIVIFAIRLRESGKLIGSCQLHNINPIHSTAELQIRLGDVAERSHGYGSQAVSLLLDFAFKDLNLNRVYLHVFINNAAAIRVYEKVGFALEGILRQAAHIDGKYLDVMAMGILRQEYETA